MKTTQNLIIVIGMIVLTILLLWGKAPSSIAREPVVKIKKQIPKETEVSVEIASDPVVTPMRQSSEKQKAAPAINGSLPPINANYRKYVGFSNYSTEMRKRGARFFVIGSSSKKIFEIDFDNNKLIRVDISKLLKGQYCPRSKVICDEPSLSYFLTIGRKELGIQDPEVHLLVPVDFEKKIASELSKSNIPLNKIISLSGYYKQSADNFYLCLNQGMTTGGHFKLDINICL